jgi:hypothetical protein
MSPPIALGVPALIPYKSKVEPASKVAADCAPRVTLVIASVEEPVDPSHLPAEISAPLLPELDLEIKVL